MRFRNSIVMTFFIGMAFSVAGQKDDLLSLLEDEETVEFVTGSFKTDRVINLHSLENTAEGELDIKISHRFGYLSGGAYELFGLDQSTIRIGGDELVHGE